MKKILSDAIVQKPVIWELRKIILCNLAWIQALLKLKKLSILRDTITYFPRYYKSIKRNNNPLAYDQPWIVFKAKELLDAILKDDMTVWEYGSGSSTLYFARRVKQVYSIENDKEWFAHLSAQIEAQQVKNVSYALVEANEVTGRELDALYFSKSTLNDGGYFESYAKSIDAIPDGSLSIALVDGRARGACIAHAIPKIKTGGYLIVDNSDRSYYFDNNEVLFDSSKWESKHFVGPVPYTFSFSKTSFFKKLGKMD
jgi:hypothetical protein